MEQMFKGKNEHGGVAGVLGTGMRPDLNTGPTPEALRGKEVKKKQIVLVRYYRLFARECLWPFPWGEKCFQVYVKLHEVSSPARCLPSGLTFGE